MSMQKLPYEIVFIIVRELDLEDVFHISMSCRRYQYLIHEERICKAMLKLRAWSSPEAQTAHFSGRYARALRRLVKRRQAIRSAAPFSAFIVAVADAWLYVNGVLCYYQNRMLRALDLHNSASQETVVDVDCLLNLAVEEFNGTPKKYKFKILHHAEGIVSCLYTRFRPDFESWLVVFNVWERKLVTVSGPLESHHKIFVRNDSNYLYYGTHSAYGEDGFRRWVLRVYDIKAEVWSDYKIHLVDMVGSDIGQSICFEIIDGYFYGLSNQTSFEVDEVEWTSYYHCFRFPTHLPTSGDTEVSVKDAMWRREHAEGPIDDRWSFIRLLKNEQDGRLQILESRKEWLAHLRSSGRRTYYTTDLRLASKEQAMHADETGTRSSDTGLENTVILSASAGDSTPPRGIHTNYGPPAKQEPRPRDPYDSHPGDDASTGLLMFVLSKFFIRSYHQPSQTFMDLVDNPSLENPESTRLQLRAGSRCIRSADQVPRSSPLLEEALSREGRIKHSYRDAPNTACKTRSDTSTTATKNKIVFWPPNDASEAQVDASLLEDLYRVTNPPSHVGNVKGTWDERSFVYSTGQISDGPQAIVFLGFDPAIRPKGMREWGKRDDHSGSCGVQAMQERRAPDEAKSKARKVVETEAPLSATSSCSPFSSVSSADSTVTAATTVTMGEEVSPRTVGCFSGDEEDEEEGWCFSGSAGQPRLSDSSRGAQGPGNECLWAWEEPAMYHEIGYGFNGLPDFNHRMEQFSVGCCT